MGGVYLAVILAAAALGAAMRGSVMAGGAVAVQVGTVIHQQNERVAMLTGVLILVYVALVMAAVVLTLTNILQRFDKNILGPEGYLMNTLPVSSGQLILSKAFSAMLWVLFSAVVSMLSMAVVFAFVVSHSSGAFGFGVVLNRMREIMAQAGGTLLINLASHLAELMLSILCGVLCIYTAILIGHQFPSFRVPVGIASFFVMSAAQSWLNELLMAVLNLPEPMNAVLYELRENGGHFVVSGPLVDGQYWMYTAVSCGMIALFGAVYFFAADWLLRTRLNLE